MMILIAKKRYIYLMQKLQEGYVDTIQGKELLSQIYKMMEEYKEFIIKAVDNREQMKGAEEYAGQHNIDTNTMHLKIAGNMGRLTKRILDDKPVDTLAAFGGNMALGIMEAIQCQGIIPTIEITPGIVVSKVISYNGFRISNVEKYVACVGIIEIFGGTVLLSIGMIKFFMKCNVSSLIPMYLSLFFAFLLSMFIVKC